MITFSLALDSHAARHAAQLRELRAEATLAHAREARGECAGCGGSQHAGICALVLGVVDRKGIGLCTTAYCKLPCVDGESVQCEGHRQANARRQRQHRERTGRMRAVRG